MILGAQSDMPALDLAAIDLRPRAIFLAGGISRGVRREWSGEDLIFPKEERGIVHKAGWGGINQFKRYVATQ